MGLVMDLLLFILFFKNCIIFLLLAVQCLHCCVGLFSSCGEGGLLSSCHAQASLVVDHRL